jgi:hypothetical protein
MADNSAAQHTCIKNTNRSIGLVTLFGLVDAAAVAVVGVVLCVFFLLSTTTVHLHSITVTNSNTLPSMHTLIRRIYTWNGRCVRVKSCQRALSQHRLRSQHRLMMGLCRSSTTTRCPCKPVTILMGVCRSSAKTRWPCMPVTMCIGVYRSSTTTRCPCMPVTFCMGGCRATPICPYNSVPI